ncbi:hypothetical protein K525DRAFT_205141 [Schizophyllum commune Loenen D]|nr:hypothetical protein K525DRAFT_205141 [Schizophyllum commune Loenen D]
MAEPSATRSGRLNLPSARLIESRLTTEILASADGIRKRKVPVKAPAPRTQRGPGSGSASASTIAKMHLDKDQVAAVMAHKAAADKRASAAASARRQTTKQSTSAMLSSIPLLMTIQPNVQARLDAALEADQNSADEDFDPHTLKKRRVMVHLDDEDVFDGMFDDEDVSSGQVLGQIGSEADDEDIGDNGMQVLALDPVTPKAKRNRRGKIAQSDFTPRTARLANSAKIQARTRTATDDAFPGEASTAALLDVSRAVDRASGPDAVTFRDAFERLQLNIQVQEDLFTYVNYASSGLRGEISLKTKEFFSTLTGIPGKQTVDEIVDVVKWLLTDSNYMYGDLDVKARTVNRNMPFHSPFIKPVITQVCFGGGKANRDAARTMIAHRQVPINLYALVGASIENVLRSWMSGTFSLIPFSEDVGRKSYLRHRASFLILQGNAPNFTQKMQFVLLKSILCDTGRVHLLDGYLTPDAGHLAGVNYEALEASVESGDEVE